MYTEKNISLIIPTYNRENDLKLTLDSITPHAYSLKEIIIIDQSSNKLTKNLILKLKKNLKNIKYFYSKPPSLTIARNLGVRKVSKSSNLICFLDDDVTLGNNYFKRILDVFNKHSEAKAVASYVPSPELSSMPILEIFLRRLFFISFPEKNKARMLSTYANTYPKKLEKIINSQWLPGVNIVYKKEIFEEFRFDENLLGYTVCEDIDFTFRLYKKYPFSLFITPNAKITHRVSKTSRYNIEKISYINQVDHFYFYYKNMSNTPKEKIIFFWSIFGISFLRSVKAFLSMKKIDALKLKFFFKSLFYCFREREKIKIGRVRDFL